MITESDIFIPPARWIERIFERFEQANPSWVRQSIEIESQSITLWAEALGRKWKTRDRCAAMIRFGITGCLTRCKFRPTLADFIAEAEEEATASGYLRHGSTGAVNTLTWRDDPVKSPKQLLAHLGKHAKSEIAQRELDKIRRILDGEDPEAVTGMTREQHMRACGL